ncbi:MAG TPA: hypothetical protein VII56_10645 [Rhizomicrobium sp.]
MTFLERFRRSPAAADLQSMATGRCASETQTDAAERRSNYANARLNELTPDIREQTRLEIRLRAAQGRLDRGRDSDQLAEQVQELETRLRVRRGEPAVQPAQPTAPARAREVEDIERALAVVRARIASKDGELKARFGLA